MRTSILVRGLQAFVLGLLATQTQAQSQSYQPSASTTAVLGAIQTLGCYSSAGPLKEDNTNTFQTSGSCQQVCGGEEQHAVMAITGGSTCYCGDVLPGLDKMVDKSKCNSPCQGFGQQMCGGIGYWQVYLTGLTGDVQTAPNSTSSSSSAVTSAVTSTHAVQSTVIVTASATASPKDGNGQSGGPNKVGIAVGVVVGVVAVVAIAGAAIIYMKKQRRKEIEAEHKAAAAINSFVGSRGSDSKSDSRLDPSMASFRRASIGSIADERDFSRRILQVKIPKIQT